MSEPSTFVIVGCAVVALSPESNIAITAFGDKLARKYSLTEGGRLMTQIFARINFYTLLVLIIKLVDAFLHWLVP